MGENEIMLVVLGCLMNEAGKKIKTEMLDKLKEHNVFCVEQEPPGKLFEYPAIKCTGKMAVDMNEPVLYIHTKGAGNAVPWYLFAKLPHRAIVDDMPNGAKPEDWQGTVRKFWYNEYTGERLKDYLNALEMNKPCVVCPFSGADKSTWQNAFIINPLAGKEILANLKLTTNRDYYEHIFTDMKNVKVKGIIYNDITRPLDDRIYKMHQYIWNYWSK